MQRQTDTEKRSSEEAMGQSQYITGETKSTLCLKLLKMYIGRSEHRLQGKDLKVCAVWRFSLQAYRFWERGKKKKKEASFDNRKKKQWGKMYSHEI